MSPEEYIPFLLNRFVPDGMKEDDLPTWVKNLREKLFSSVFKKFKQFDENSDEIDIAGFVSGAAKHLDESLESLSSMSDIPINQDVTNDDLDRFKDDLNLINSFVEEANESQKDLNSEEDIKFTNSKLQGLQSLFDGNLNLKFESLDTKLTLAMLINWPYIQDTIKTRSECYNYLIKIPFLKEFDVGSYERVEKFFERVGYSPAKPGRPKK
ncbi:MAG: hypothetical protein VXZ32_09940 [Verrucomicrobiota bacterium]|nr:hypothetical protein [Verrucomicrobiota bacterium]